jgi:hypothetical protein
MFFFFPWQLLALSNVCLLLADYTRKYGTTLRRDLLRRETAVEYLGMDASP